MRILIIEDEEMLANALKKGLEKDGYAVDYVLEGEAGQRRIEMCHNDYDLVVLDLMLPKKNGLEISRDIRAQKITLPILILTGKDSTEDKVAALDAGADDYLVKPFSLEELRARVRALLRRPTPVLPNVLKVKDLLLDTTTHKSMRKGKEIPLTLKEFSLLEYLMRHPNQVLTREQILDHVWDFAFDSFSNIVDVHMKNLRKKIDDEGGNRLLETIRGVGYKING